MIMTESKKNKVVPASVKVGHLMAFTYYTKVEHVSADGCRLVVSDLDSGLEKISIDGRDLVENSISADYFKEEEKVTKTKAAELLVSSHGKLFTVCFVKTDGEERVLRGRLVNPEPLLGRSTVEDLEQPAGKRIRLVDHRTIRWLVLEGVKYIVKD
jgi:hypothetical protein